MSPFLHLLVLSVSLMRNSSGYEDLTDLKSEGLEFTLASMGWRDSTDWQRL